MYAIISMRAWVVNASNRLNYHQKHFYLIKYNYKYKIYRKHLTLWIIEPHGLSFTNVSLSHPWAPNPHPHHLLPPIVQEEHPTPHHLPPLPSAHSLCLSLPCPSQLLPFYIYMNWLKKHQILTYFHFELGCDESCGRKRLKPRR
jgi:hypothetical protein